MPFRKEQSAGRYQTIPIPLPPEARFIHRFHNNMTALEHGPWILRPEGFDGIAASQDVVILGWEAGARYWLAGALGADRSTTHFFPHREYGRFTRLGIWQPELHPDDPDEELVFLEGTDWRDLLVSYWKAAAERNGVRFSDRDEPVTGYCSWYYHFDAPSEDIFREEARGVADQADLPLRYLQIDDGYQTFHGDWLEQNERWPTPLAEIVAEFRAMGFETGIWLMPFHAARGSRLARERPEWFVKDEAGDPVYVPGWSLPPNDRWQCLDLSHPGAREHVREVFRKFREMGITYFKLDGLGFAGQRGLRHDPRATGSSALREGLLAIREAAGDAWILGCGASYLAGIGVFDSNRVSCDTGLNWEPRGLPNQPETIPGLPQRHPDPVLPGAENAIRASLFNWWRFEGPYLCDPDVVIVRDEFSTLSDGEARLSALAAVLAGISFTSDPVARLPDRRRRLLKLANQTRMRGVRPLRIEADGLLEVFSGRIAGRPAVAVFNFSAEPKTYPLAGPEACLPEEAREWLAGHVLAEDGSLTLPAHDGALLAEALPGNVSPPDPKERR